MFHNRHCRCLSLPSLVPSRSYQGRRFSLSLLIIYLCEEVAEMASWMTSDDCQPHLVPVNTQNIQSAGCSTIAFLNTSRISIGRRLMRSQHILQRIYVYTIDRVAKSKHIPTTYSETYIRLSSPGSRLHHVPSINARKT